MIIKNIKITNFRNYENLQITLKPTINIIYGNNGGGKTNILESIFVLALTKSHRTTNQNDLIKHGKENALIKGTITNQIPYNLELILTKTTKKVKVDNKVINKIGTYISTMNIIIFSANDLELIRGFPSERRKYLNLQLSQISKNYYEELNKYNKLLKIRNDYLKKISQKENIDTKYFQILTDYLIEKSIFIYQMREKYIEKINKTSTKIYKNITNNDNFKIKYIPSINLKDFEKQTIRKTMQEELKNTQEKEIKLKTTLCGPHRDDFEFCLNQQNLKNYGSQGQQRVAVLTLKLSEINIFKDYKKNNPIILLDDVFSELDKDKKNNILRYIKEDMQVIITTTDLNNISETIKKKAKLIKIQNGKIIEEVE